MNDKLSYRRLLEFSQVAQSWLQRNPAKTKFQYALNRVMAQLAKVETEAQEALGDIDVEHCSEDAQGNVILENNAYKFTKEKFKLRNKERREYFDLPQFEVVPYFATKVPDTLTEYELTVFADLVIAPDVLRRIEVDRELEESPAELVDV